MRLMTNFIKSLLQTAMDALDQSSQRAAKLSDQVSDLADRAKDTVYIREDHTGKMILIFVAGIGAGVLAGMLLAPATGEDTRDAIGENLRNIGDKVRERVSGGKDPQPLSDGADSGHG